MTVVVLFLAYVFVVAAAWFGLLKLQDRSREKVMRQLGTRWAEAAQAQREALEALTPHDRAWLTQQGWRP